MKHAIFVCTSVIIIIIIPMAIGCFICVNISLIVLIVKSSFVMSGGILCKMLVMGINEMVFAFPLSFKNFKRVFLMFDLQDQYFR
jgi:hypothetical protein